MAVTNDVQGEVTKPVHRVTWKEFFARLAVFASELNIGCRVYGVPRSGMIVAGFLCDLDARHSFTHDPRLATLIIDDIVDHGKTRECQSVDYPSARFFALFDKTGADAHLGKIVMPWEPDKIEEDNTRHIQAVRELVDSLEFRGLWSLATGQLLRASLSLVEETNARNPMV